MSIEMLEEKYRHLKPWMKNAEPLFHCALQASAIQNHMRAILAEAASGFCGPCDHKCCEGFPLEGWFTFEDYVLFRTLYDKPDIPPNRIMRNTACSFLTPEGCSLPADMRPFTCVKINCEPLNGVLKRKGKDHHFNLLRKALDAILLEVSRRINEEGISPSPDNKLEHHAKDAPAINMLAG